MRARLSDCTRSTAASAVRPVRDRLAQPVQPALVVGEHAVGLEHLAVLAAVGDVAALEHARRRSARSAAIASSSRFDLASARRRR